MPSRTGGHCAHCHKPFINGLRYPLNGQVLCYDCYSAMQKEIVDKEQKLQDLYSFLKQDVFMVDELETETINAIDHAINKDGRTVNGIKLTLTYYYKILGNPSGEQHLVGWIIKNTYDNAKKYYIEQQQIRRNNDSVDVNIAPVHLTINPEKLHRDDKKDKFPYNMEDL